MKIQNGALAPTGSACLEKPKSDFPAGALMEVLL